MSNRVLIVDDDENSKSSSGKILSSEEMKFGGKDRNPSKPCHPAVNNFRNLFIPRRKEEVIILF